MKSTEGQQQASPTAQSGQQDALGQQLPEQAEPASANGCADGDLLLPRHGPCQ